ncbi:MAG: acetylxylan esterase [Phycisphaerae bacterium]
MDNNGTAGYCNKMYYLLLLVMLGSFGVENSTRAVETPIKFPDKGVILTIIDQQGKSKSIKNIKDWQKKREIILKNLQRVMGALPGPDVVVPLDIQVLQVKEEPDYIRKKITYTAEKGDRVPAYLMIPKKLKNKNPAMLCLHQTIKIGKDEPAGLGGISDLHYAKELTERGYITIIPDYMYFGENNYDPYKHGYSSATMKGIWNHKRAIDVLVSLPEVDANRIGCIGHSLGGVNTVFVACFDPRIKVIVVSCGFGSFYSYYNSPDIEGWSSKYYMPRIASMYHNHPSEMPFDFTDIVATLAPRPFFGNATLKDGYFHYDGVKHCVDSVKPVYKLFNAEEKFITVTPDCEHSFPPDSRTKAYQFIDRYLKPNR